MPKKVAKEIIRLQSRFLWNGKAGKGYPALVKWDIIQRPKKQGGLGVGDLMIKNAALLFKWWWRFACEEGAMWRRVIQSIHEEEQVLLPTKDRVSLPGPWKDIKQIARKETPITKAFFENLSVKIGVDSKVRFWLDIWTNNKPLKEIFPSLFAISTQQKEIISNMGWFEGNMWRWTLSWSRAPSAEEQHQMMSLQDLLQQQQPDRDMRDQLQWCGKPILATKSLADTASQLSLRNVAVDHLAPTVWMNIAPPKVELMVWLALLGKLNTKDMLAKKQIIPQESNLCTFCSLNGETCDHLLANWSVVWQVWCNIGIGLGLRQMQQQQTFRQWYEWWLAQAKVIKNRGRKKMFLVSFFAITWSIWNKRNLMVFQNQEFEHHSFCHTVKWKVALWLKEGKENMPYSHEDIVRHFNDIPVLFP